jgi:hypothetical protein
LTESMMENILSSKEGIFPCWAKLSQLGKC